MIHNPKARIVRQKMIFPGCCLLTILSPDISRTAKPGQFIQVRILPLLDSTLRRPFSIHRVDREEGELSLLYRVVGRGTALLSMEKENNFLDIIGPLGNGFTIPEGKKKLAIAAGGIGIAPLFFLLQELAQSKNKDFSIYTLLGARTREELILADEITSLTDSFSGGVKVATDDGTVGHSGPVTELLEEVLANRLAEMVYVCGPHDFLRVSAAMLEKYGAAGQLSIEERMACGIGACYSCVCRTNRKKGEQPVYKRVCLDGPVFYANEVAF
ncbi:MAG TPA: dihydroorotate dehydrogenase electron transfer subunit [Desulfotomaculum sp.]|nr:MAG: Dihydroorotate dehydrogenase B (NAD(+)), electron transfer subunit [Desulfotomaculum sp. 46_80]KUK85038.1 MAG: Dihydroorotate dehydrogenase B (NAD(+)), electron transfer subunit [Desulfofundulus kuznetsovii]HAG10917.1 dihydroorotate dehydrogenase electron transfer subunit [Desulfotomaculum sp.]HBY03976.1 dihydroorotate dehydrogenase electron transfer subunit [Desulfotomaculum sp.]